MNGIHKGGSKVSKTFINTKGRNKENPKRVVVRKMTEDFTKYEREHRTKAIFASGIKIAYAHLDLTKDRDRYLHFDTRPFFYLSKKKISWLCRSVLGCKQRVHDAKELKDMYEDCVRFDK